MLLTTVAAIMSVMLVVSAASAAFAHNRPCTGGPFAGSLNVTPGTNGDEDGDGLVCYRPNIHQGYYTFFDDHDHN